MNSWNSPPLGTIELGSLDDWAQNMPVWSNLQIRPFEYLTAHGQPVTSAILDCVPEIHER